jgi:uncharacterized protein YndB with AHSA1/START domain
MNGESALAVIQNHRLHHSLHHRPRVSTSFCGASRCHPLFGAHPSGCPTPLKSLGGNPVRVRIPPWASGACRAAPVFRLKAGPTMPDILHDFPINVPPARVYQAISTPADLDQWWTEQSSGEPRAGAEYRLYFGPEYDWRAVVRRSDPSRAFEFGMTSADEEWTGTRIGFELEGTDEVTQVRFYHRGWPGETEHYRVSCYCWAMYLRGMRRYLELGEIVPYERRLDV